MMMMPGLLSPTLETTLALGTGLVLFSEDVQRVLCAHVNRKAAQAAGIGALAMRAIDTGDHNSLEDIAALAEELAEQLHSLASVTGQIATSKTA